MASRSTIDSSSSASTQDSEKSFEGEVETEEQPKPQKLIDPRTLLTPLQIQQYKEIFSALDPQKQGKIPTRFLSIVIRSLGYNPTKAQIRQLLSSADPERKGTVDFQGFLLPIAEMMDVVPETFDDILRAFKALDERDMGYINANDFYEFMTTMGEYLEDFEIELLIKMSSPKGEGKVKYVEFLEKQFGIQKKRARASKDGKPKKKKGKKKKK